MPTVTDNTIPSVKTCRSCKQILPVLDFYTRSDSKDGLHAQCKRCMSTQMKSNYAKNQEVIRQRVQARYQSLMKTNPDIIRKSKREWYQKNKTRLQEKKRAYIAANRQKHNLSSRQWAARNPHLVSMKWRKNRASKYQCAEHFTLSEWRTLCRTYENKCLGCGQFKQLEADHVVPLSVGGSNRIDNIQPLCRSCNAKKGKKIVDFREGATIHA